MKNVNSDDAAQVEISAEKYDACQHENPRPGEPVIGRNAGYRKTDNHQAESMELMIVEGGLEPASGIVRGQLGLQAVHAGSVECDGQGHVECAENEKPAGESGQGVHRVGSTEE